MSSRLDPYALVGTTVRERFSVDSFVSVGRFSAVYRGTELDSLAPVALRLLKVRSNLTPSARTVVVERLRGLSRPMTEIAQQCPTFADVLEVGALITAQGRWLPLSVQTWLEGKTLEAIVADERTRGIAPRTLARAMELLAPVADALAYAHARGVVHGSVAPRNVFIGGTSAPGGSAAWSTPEDAGEVRVLDLGMAGALHAIQTKDRAFAEGNAPVFCFAPSHGAPEQFDERFGAAGPATDVFALALVLSELVSGRAPLGEGDDEQLEAASTNLAIRPTPRTHGRDLGDHVESVFERALAVRAADRYGSVASFWDALRAASRVMARSSTPPPLSASMPPLASPSIPPRDPMHYTPVGAIPDAPAPRSRRSVPPPLPDSEVAKAAYTLEEMLPPRPPAPSIHDAPTPRESIPALSPEAAESAITTSEATSETNPLFDGEPHESAPTPMYTRIHSPAAVEVPPPPALPTSYAPHASSIVPHAPASGSGWTATTRALALAAAFAIGAGVTVAVQRGSTPRAAEPATGTTIASAVVPAPPPPKPTCAAGMIEIHGGHFFMGSDDDLPQEKPAHPVTLSPYCIDASEVTVAQYKACSDGGLCKRAATQNEWPGIAARDRKAFDPLCNARVPDERGEHPINCVDWEMAATYCAAHGARLPTEAEWEFAARGSDGRRYPWGDDDPTPKHLNACGSECVAWGRAHGIREDAMYEADDGWPTTAPVGSFPLGDSPFGLHDVVGNVWEWTSDWFDSYAEGAQTDPKGPASGDERVIRGGAWNGAYADWVRPTFRWKNVAEARSYGIGFRCAKPLGG